MDISRKIGIGIVMIIPTFVGGGVVWYFLNSWLAVLVWIIVIASGYGVMMGKFFCKD
ncbi:MAG: hypothetical protein JRJ23_09925 [Deltaproteobacteria bacterium]|nr:hypothetical protein [Deltaproteobacteria bacterium]MBW1914850.1 hypothetical protein [Deltaproteobacteria bacterium]